MKDFLKDLEPGMIVLWALALAALLFIGWGCQNDESAGGRGIDPMDGAITQDDGGTPDDGTGRGGEARWDVLLAVDQSTDGSRDGATSDTNPDGQGIPGPETGDDGPNADMAWSAVELSSDRGTSDLGTPGDGGQESGASDAWQFTPGRDFCGTTGGAHYVACCPPGIDCKAKYGDREFCDCAVQPRGQVTTCHDYQQINPKTAPIPTRCL